MKFETGGRKEEIVPKQFDLYVKRSLWLITSSVLNEYRSAIAREYIASAEELEKMSPQEMDSESEMIQIRTGDTVIYLEDENLAEAIRKLPKRFRKAIDLRYLQDMDYDDICKELNLTRDSAQVYISNALRRLKKNLKEGGHAKKF